MVFISKSLTRKLLSSKFLAHGINVQLNVVRENAS